MQALRRSRLAGTLLGAACAVWLLPQAAHAQYRAPLVTDAEKLMDQADAARRQGMEARGAGDTAQASAQFRKAADLYERALRLEPSNLKAADGLAVSAGELEDYARVERLLAPVHTAKPAVKDVSFQLGVALMKLNRSSEAIPLLEDAASSADPKFSLAHYYLGASALQRKQPAEAIKQLRSYLASRPSELSGTDAVVWGLLGRAYLQTKNAGEARHAYQQALELRPDAMEPAIGLASVLEMEGKRTAAINQLKATEAQHPDSIEPRMRMGTMYLSSGALALAEEQANQMMARPDWAPSGHLLRGKIRLALNHPTEAEREVQEALRLAPTLLDAQLEYARVLQAEGKYLEAAKVQANILAIPEKKDDAELWTELGLNLRRAKYPDRAIAAHRRLVQLADKVAVSHGFLADDYYAAERWSEAAGQYTKASERDPSDPRWKHRGALALRQRAHALALKDDWSHAEADLRNAQALEPSAPGARALAAVLLKGGNPEGAVKVLTEARALPGTDWHDGVLEGWARWLLRDIGGARSRFDEARKAGATGALLTQGEALTSLEEGDVDSAVDALRTAPVNPTLLGWALVRRGVSRLEAGDLSAAAQDVDAARALGPLGEAVQSDVDLLAVALVAERKGESREFSAAARKLDKRGGLTPCRQQLLLMDAALRRGDESDARKLSRSRVCADAAEAQDLERATQAFRWRQAARAYASGELDRARRLYEDLGAGAATAAEAKHNLACVDYLQGKGNPAAVWGPLQARIPEAVLDLGLNAESRKGDLKTAQALYTRYLGLHGRYPTEARRWLALLKLRLAAEPLPPVSEEVHR